MNNWSLIKVLNEGIHWNMEQRVKMECCVCLFPEHGLTDQLCQSCTRERCGVEDWPEKGNFVG